MLYQHNIIQSNNSSQANRQYSQLNRWSSRKAHLMTENNLRSLLDNEIPAIYLPGVATVKECASLSEAAEYVGFENYLNVNPPIGRIGITQFEAKNFSKDWYFDEARKISILQAEMFKRSFDPLARLRNLLIEIGRMQTLYAKEYNQNYFVGLMRQINTSALIHADYAPFDAPEWSIGEIDSQLAWNLCVSEPEEGGDCIVHNKKWEKEDEIFKLQNSYGYSRELVQASEKFLIKVKVGDAVTLRRACVTRCL